jgi:hypothetical protein
VAARSPFTTLQSFQASKPKYEAGPPPTSDTVVIEAWETDGIKATTAVVLDGTSVTDMKS